MQEGQGRRRPCHWTIYQELCQLIIRGGQIGPTKNVEITNPKTYPRPMKCYRNYLINFRDLLNVHLDSTGKHQMESLVKKGIYPFR